MKLFLFPERPRLAVDDGPHWKCYQCIKVNGRISFTEADFRGPSMTYLNVNLLIFKEQVDRLSKISFVGNSLVPQKRLQNARSDPPTCLNTNEIISPFKEGFNPSNGLPRVIRPTPRGLQCQQITGMSKFCCIVLYSQSILLFFWANEHSIKRFFLALI